jgi:hypothetical protein
MTFEAWWAALPTAEQKLLGKNNAHFVWEEAQKNTVNMITLPNFVIGRHGDTVSIMSFHGEGGTFDTKEFDDAVSKFFAEKF